MFDSFLSKALVPLFFISTCRVLAQGGSCKVDKGVSFSFYSLGNAGVDAGFRCEGTTKVAGPANRAGGGVGTYTDPAHFAWTDGDTTYQECEIVYIPFFKKYFRYNDHCGDCQNNGIHIDLWVGPPPKAEWKINNDIPTGYGKEISACAVQLGRKSGSIVRYPHQTGLDVDKRLIVQESGCPDLTSHEYPPDQASCTGGGDNNNEETSPSSAPASQPTIRKESQKQGGEFIEQNAPSSSADAIIPDNTGEPRIPDLQVAALERNRDDDIPSASSSAASSASSASASAAPTSAPASFYEKPTTGRGKGEKCPENDWFEGCVWGSGPGQLGDACTAKTDCFGEYICVGGKCVDNVRGSTMMRRGHKRRHMGGLMGVKKSHH